MANIKFSAFTQKVAQADVDFLVGYTGADNVRITPAALGDGIYLPLGGGTMIGNVIFNDNVSALFGTSSDMTIKHDGSNSKIENNTGDLYIINEADNEDIIFQSDDGAGGVGTYFFLDGSQATGTTVYTKFPDNSIISLGDGSDCYIRHDGTDTRIDNSMGDLIIRNYADDKDILFYSDDGSGGTAQYFRVDGSLVETGFVKNTHHYDNVKANFGDGNDLEIYHDGSNSYIQDTGTGNLLIDGANNVQIRSATDSAVGLSYAVGGPVYLYHAGSLKFNTTATGIEVADEVSIGTSIIHTGDTDTKISFGTDEIVLTTAGADAVTVDSSGNVGIGTAPTDKLNINTGVGTFDFKDYNLTYSTSLGIRAESGYLHLVTESANDFYISTNGFANKRFTVKSDGKIGIGTDAPTAALQVVGLVEYADNAAALLAGLTAGAFYRTGDLLKVVH